MPKNLLGALAPLLIILTAAVLRWDQISLLLGKDNGNVLTCYDCFRYALLTEQRAEGFIPSVNHLVNVPDFTANLEAERMITYLGVLLTALGLDLNHVYVIAPPLFGVLFTVPLFLWVRRFADLPSFLGAGLLGAFNFIYWVRTSPGRYDTDFLILFFLFLTLWLLTIALEESRPERALSYTLLAGLSLNVFMWWYPKPVFVFLFTLSLMLGCFLFRSSLKLGAARVVLFLVTGGLANVVQGVKQLWGYVESRIFYEPSTFVPVSISASVVELQPLTVNELVGFTSDNPLFVAVGFAGLLLLTVKRFSHMAPALPFLAMGLSTFVAGNRMLIYLAPFLGLGIGFLAEEAYRLLSPRLSRFRKVAYAAVLTAVFFMSFPPYVFAVKGKLLFSDEFYNELVRLRQVVPPGAFVWTWWDFGNVVQYTMRRGTYIDNGNWHIVKTYAVAHSLVLEDEGRAERIVSYVSNNRELDLRYRDRDYREFLRDAVSYGESLRNEVYVLLSPDLLMKPLIRQIGSYGTDREPEFRAIGSEIYYCEQVGALVDCGIFVFDTERGTPIRLPADTFRVYVYDRDGGRLLSELPGSDGGRFVLIFVKDKGRYYASLVERGFVNSNLVRWFLFRKSSHMDLVYDNFPLVVLYRVN